MSVIVFSDQWKNMSKALSGAGHSLIAVQDNLIEAIWEDRPARPSTKLITLGLKFTGQHISLDDLQYRNLILQVSHKASTQDCATVK